MSQFAKGIDLKNAKAITKKEIYFFINFHQLICSFPSISCLDLELIAVTVFVISSFLCQKFAKGSNWKKIFFFIFIE